MVSFLIVLFWVGIRTVRSNSLRCTDRPDVGSENSWMMLQFLSRWAILLAVVHNLDNIGPGPGDGNSSPGAETHDRCIGVVTLLAVNRYRNRRETNGIFVTSGPTDIEIVIAGTSRDRG